jgi:hypothetical protein
VASANNNWLFKGIETRGVSCFNTTNSANFEFFDTICNTSASTGFFIGMTNTDNNSGPFILRKSLYNPFGASSALINYSASGSSGAATVKVYDSAVIATSSTVGIVNVSQPNLVLRLEIYDTTALFAANAVLYTLSSNTNVYADIKTRNLKTNVTQTGSRFSSVTAAYMSDSIADEDYEGIIGSNRYWNTTSPGGPTATSTLANSTGFLRPGGGPTSIWTIPGTRLSNKADYHMLQLFEYPIYTDTSSKTYSVYFMSTTTGTWTANPTNKELWIECEYWNYPAAAATSTRTTTRSTGVLDFTGSTAWQSLSVTCQPTQTGILYLRGWYGKPRESGKINEFYVDSTPVII